MVIQLKAGALGVPLDVVQSQTVGPTLGQDSLRPSLLAGIVGLSIVALFMILYYRLPGAVSVLALLIYTALVFAIFKLVTRHADARRNRRLHPLHRHGGRR